MRLLIQNFHWLLGHGNSQELKEQAEKMLRQRQDVKKVEPILFEYLASRVWQKLKCRENEDRSLNAQDLSAALTLYDDEVKQSIPPIITKIMQIHSAWTAKASGEYIQHAQYMVEQIGSIIENDFPGFGPELKARCLAAVFGKTLGDYKRHSMF